MRKIARKIVTFLLVLSIIISLPLTAFAQGRQLYVCIGDSNASGYNTAGWIANHTPAPEAYHSKVAEAMDMDLITYATGGYRTDEILYMIDPTFEMDWFYGDNLSHGFNHKVDLDAYKDDYVEAIKKADVLSIQVGLNDIVGEDLGNSILTAFYMPNPTVESLKATFENLPGIGEALTAALDKVAPVFQAIVFVQDFSARVKVTNAEFARNWDRIMELIYEMNPDVTVVALTMHNPLGNTTITPGSSLKVGKIAGLLFKTINDYIRSGSEYSDKYLVCDISDIPGGDLAITQPDFEEVYLKQVHPTEDSHTEIANRIVNLLEGK